jgi:TonB family protein
MDEPCPKRNSTRPNIAGFTSAVQQAEMKLLLAGKWPPLKPLPIFKYETDEYRASIDFDKTRGEWVCRKTSLPSNKVEELRGGLTEIIMALRQGQAEVFAECAAAELQEQELEKDASRRLQAMLEWTENYESGALYSGLRDYLSESQQDEIDGSIRLTLTARQLQFNPKNVDYVFDALSKAGGKLATLIKIAQQNKKEKETDVPAKAEAAAPDAEVHVPVEAIHPTRDRRLKMRTTPASRAYVEFGGSNGGIVLNISETGMAIVTADPLVVDDYLPRIRFPFPNSGQSIEISAQIVWLAESKKSAGIRFVDLTVEARSQISNWIASEKPVSEFEGLTAAPVEKLIPASLESFPEEPIGSVLPERDQPSSPELIAYAPSQASEIVTPEILDVNPPSFVEDLHEKVHHHAPVAVFEPQVRTSKVELLADRIENSPSRLYALEISGFQVAAIMFLFAVTSLAVGLTVGRGPLGGRLWDTQKSIPAVDATSSALLNGTGEAISRTSTPPAADNFLTPEVSPAATATSESRPESPSAQSLSARPEDSAASVGPIGTSSSLTARSLTDSDNPKASPGRKGSTGLIAPPPANSRPAHSARPVDPISGAPANPAARRATTATRAAPYRSSPSTILVGGPGDGSKPFRLVLPQEPIAASSSFAMTSQLSVLVAPDPGPEVTHEPARLQAGKLVSFVWPRYPRPGDRHGSSETVKLRTTIGELGQVLDVKHESGSISLLPAAMSAIRQWRYKPTLLNNRPVQVQQDVTIEFRTPQHLPRMSTRHPSHN